MVIAARNAEALQAAVAALNAQGPGRAVGDAAQFRERMKNDVPAKRFGTADEFGAACAFLCSRFGGCITGQNLLLDGGQYRGLM